MASGIHYFYSTSVTNPHRNAIANKVVKLGDWTLTPIRYLLKGASVEIKYSETLKHLFFAESEPSFPKRTYPRLIAAIIFLVPGLIIGSAFKGIGHLFSAEIRKERALINCFKNYLLEKLDPINFDNVSESTPIVRTDIKNGRAAGIVSGSDKGIASQAEFDANLREGIMRGLGGRCLSELITHLTPEAVISDFPGIKELDPRRLVFIGGSFDPSPELKKALMSLGFTTILSADGTEEVPIYEVESEEELDQMDPWMNARTLKPAGEIYLIN